MPNCAAGCRRAARRRRSPRGTRGSATVRRCCRWSFVEPLRRRLARAGVPSSEGTVMPWMWLIIGGLFEVGFTTSLRFVDGFRNVPWTVVFLISVAISMALLEVASRAIAMGTAYAVWGGIGAVGTVIVGILWFHEPASTLRVLLILAIVAAIAGLRLTA